MDREEVFVGLEGRRDLPAPVGGVSEPDFAILVTAANRCVSDRLVAAVADAGGEAMRPPRRRRGARGAAVARSRLIPAQAGTLLSRSCTRRTTAAPSPTAVAQRLSEPDRTSPAA